MNKGKKSVKKATVKSKGELHPFWVGVVNKFDKWPIKSKTDFLISLANNEQRMKERLAKQEKVIQRQKAVLSFLKDKGVKVTIKK